jgi:hypothetical protein
MAPIYTHGAGSHKEGTGTMTDVVRLNVMAELTIHDLVQGLLDLGIPSYESAQPEEFFRAPDFWVEYDKAVASSKEDPENGGYLLLRILA